MAGAQDSDQISAVLQVEDQTPQVFFGASALKSAIEAAPDHGGVITLTSGQFNAADITKDVIIYGAGFETDAEKGVFTTSIRGDINVNLPEGVSAPHGIFVEGIWVTGNINVKSAVDGLTLSKSSFNNIDFDAPATRCVITQSYVRAEIIDGFDLYVQNSYVKERVMVMDDASYIRLDHCILTRNYDDNYYSYTNRMRYNCSNCIVTNTRPMNIQTYNYCIMTGVSNLNGYSATANNYFLSIADVFDDCINNATYSEERTFELKNPTTYVGSDGKPIGPSGGIGWNKIPSTPIVKNLDATVNGTSLEVDYDAEVR
jgi:hypothetical protein